MEGAKLVDDATPGEACLLGMGRGCLVEVEIVDVAQHHRIAQLGHAAAMVAGVGPRVDGLDHGKHCGVILGRVVERNLLPSGNLDATLGCKVCHALDKVGVELTLVGEPVIGHKLDGDIAAVPGMLGHLVAPDVDGAEGHPARR